MTVDNSRVASGQPWSPGGPRPVTVSQDSNPGDCRAVGDKGTTDRSLQQIIG